MYTHLNKYVYREQLFCTNNFVKKIFYVKLLTQNPFLYCVHICIRYAYIRAPLSWVTKIFVISNWITLHTIVSSTGRSWKNHLLHISAKTCLTDTCFFWIWCTLALMKPCVVFNSFECINFLNLQSYLLKAENSLSPFNSPHAVMTQPLHLPLWVPTCNNGTATVPCFLSPHMQ